MTRGPAIPERQQSADLERGTEFAVIYVTRLDGSQLVVNADLIETVEHTADTVITLLDSKKLVVKTLVHEVVERVIGYRQMIARGPMRMVDTPPLGPAVAALQANQQPIPLHQHEVR